MTTPILIPRPTPGQAAALRQALDQLGAAMTQGFAAVSVAAQAAAEALAAAAKAVRDSQAGTGHGGRAVRPARQSPYGPPARR